MSDVEAVLALKNAWNGAVAASEEIRAMAGAVHALPPDIDLKTLDYETYRRVTLAQANAVMALRGLVEQLQRKNGVASGTPDAAP